ncbi:MAG: MYG1 family protein [Desulfobacterales bacterium]|nr:MYG1 family protein [Desulfobacterales bacterium]MCP4162626.1 MYG1 family protein [Deltaproteobacteria bacterium]
MKNLIITHPGKSHFDEFCAVSLILASNKDEEFVVERREPLVEELQNPDVWIVDIGNVHNPKLKNFDHHQDLSIPVSFVLVADYLGLTDSLSKLSFWSFKDKIDRFGPVYVAKELGVESLATTHSPMEVWLLEMFENKTSESIGLMKDFGTHIINKAKELSSQLKFWEQCEKIEVKNHIVIFGLTENTKGIEEYINSMNRPASICVSYDNRGDGWKIRRHNDFKGVDFSVLEGHPDIQFAHKGGFIAKTNKRISKEQLIEFIKLGIS